MGDEYDETTDLAKVYEALEAGQKVEGRRPQMEGWERVVQWGMSGPLIWAKGGQIAIRPGLKFRIYAPEPEPKPEPERLDVCCLRLCCGSSPAEARKALPVKPADVLRVIAVTVRTVSDETFVAELTLECIEEATP